MDFVIVMGACSKENRSSELSMLKMVALNTHISVLVFLFKVTRTLKKDHMWPSVQYI